MRPRLWISPTNSLMVVCITFPNVVCACGPPRMSPHVLEHVFHRAALVGVDRRGAQLQRLRARRMKGLCPKRDTRIGLRDFRDAGRKAAMGPPNRAPARRFPARAGTCTAGRGLHRVEFLDLGVHQEIVEKWRRLFPLVDDRRERQVLPGARERHVEESALFLNLKISLRASLPSSDPAGNSKTGACGRATGNLLSRAAG